MTPQPSGDWRVFKPIVADHWGTLQHAHPRYQPSYYEGWVTKMLACGNPEQRGYVADRCVPCGQGKPLVALRCQASWCLRCAKVYVDNWVSQVRQVLHEGVISRPIILTGPAMFRTPLYQNAAVVLSAFMRCGAQCLDDCSSEVRGQALRGGSMTVLHPHGRHGPYHPHLHRLATSGGDDPQGERWEPLQDLPYELRRRTWQWHLLRMVRQTLRSEAIHQWVDTCFRKYPNGLVRNVQQGTVPSQSQSVARYVAQEVVSPPIAVRRIDHYDGERVTDHDRSHRTDRMERATVAVDTCIGRMMQHTMPKGCKRIRSSGVQATKTCAKVQAVMHVALATVEGVVKGAVKILARLTSRQRYEQRTGRDPVRCPPCQHAMGVWRLWHPTYGLIYDEGEGSKRGTYASTAPRAGP